MHDDRYPSNDFGTFPDRSPPTTTPLLNNSKTSKNIIPPALRHKNHSILSHNVNGMALRSAAWRVCRSIKILASALRCVFMTHCAMCAVCGLACMCCLPSSRPSTSHSHTNATPIYIFYRLAPGLCPACAIWVVLFDDKHGAPRVQLPATVDIFDYDDDGDERRRQIGTCGIDKVLARVCVCSYKMCVRRVRASSTAYSINSPWCVQSVQSESTPPPHSTLHTASTYSSDIWNVRGPLAATVYKYSAHACVVI